MAFAWYTPTLVQAFGTPKNSDINANLNAIAAAFNAQNSWALVQGSYAIPSTGTRNVLVDLSLVAGNTNIVLITLPTSPVVGDPPVNICVRQAATSNLLQAACVICTSDGALINGATTTSPSYGTLPFLTNTGDLMSFVYVGVSRGWIYNYISINPYVNPTGGIPQPWGGYSSAINVPFHKLDTIADTSGGTLPWTLNLSSTYIFPGWWTSFTRRSGNNNISCGTSGQTFNGSVGPYVISSSNVRYLFTCTSANTFVVTT